MRILYIDCPMGISGDMFLGALIDLGIDSRKILREVRKLPVDKKEIDVKIGTAVRHSISGTTFKVRIKETRHHRTFRDIKRLIKGSELTEEVKKLSLAIFKTIAEAEGRVHGIRPEKVHFHEVGAMDSIIDIVGAAAAVDLLGVVKFVSSPIALGTGWTETMHGTLPVPAPATIEILKGTEVARSTVPFELTTPTGAAIVKTLAAEFGPIPDMTIEAAGYGAGKKDFKERANVLRVIKGTIKDGVKPGRVFVLEANVDDMNPQIAGFLMEKCLGAGALETYFTPVQMKKSRPGVLITVLVPEEKKEDLLNIIFNESTTIGVRAHPVERRCLERKTAKVKTPYGAVHVKVSFHEGRVVNVQPEYEDCRALAEKKKVPLKEVIAAARSAFKGA
ncbi:MAG: nickel pincer cofactor biosynthesis protein LarC [Thermodesulfobacteriota bacterium]|nr:MAG: nickel pincer cofactor biosynthesis protein LarC [Thermodesulfobacteriota bacterium]